MESAISQVQKGNQFSALSILKPKNGVSCTGSCFLPVQKNQQKEKRVLRVDKILMKNELNLEEEIIEMKKLINEKCKKGNDDYDVVGIVELLECLEREAIMGEDKGRDPNDYNRRALIFDKSSRVFQALKQVQNNTAV
ncbi:hypothetical protein PHJA_001082100 [Phtheirospermum japonicum]|uniref:Uncharacterized protein n=1 Tax=Phtheirospermum japonicum TaxID=374723 RepID=A0A830BYL4_9LAMI|nr:hypothetical protein PHJA_001082100 [Phtheirospermum japonicum]